MSEIREKLLGSSALRSRAIKVVTLSIILISAFAFSTALMSLIFDSQRYNPSNSKDDALYEDTILVAIPFPWSLEDFLDFLDGLGLELDPEDLDSLMDMFDGIPDGLDLSQFAGLLAAALFSDVEVFRVYQYSDINNMEDILWKYECFDEYNGGSWETSETPDNYDFYSYSDHASNYPSQEIYKIKLLLNMTPSVGEQNTFTAPSLFPTPFIMENSVSAPNIIPSSTVLRKQPGVVSGIEDGLNSTAIIAEFSSSAGTNVSYELFGIPLQPDIIINSSAIRPDDVTTPSAGYTNLKNHYIDTFNGGPMANYISTYSDFAYHYNYLDNNVINRTTDNAFIIADKIRNYLQYNFNLSYNPAPGTDDPINYFFNTQEGLYSDFAAAFCALTRAFGVASRFVDGFNSLLIEEIFDPVEGVNGFAIKYRNMYNWAEIYVPTDASGNGNWVQMDVYYDNFMGNPPSPIFGNDSYSLSVSTLYENFPVNRGTPVTITATLLNNSMPMPGETISFIDLTTNTPLPSNTTNLAGIASITVPVDGSTVVGPHIIKALYNPTVANASHYLVNGPTNVTITSVTPQEVNISETPHDIQVQGYVYDPVASEYVKHSNLNFVMLINGTSTIIPNAFIPFYTTTDENGAFDVTIEVNQFISGGPREIRADFNGTWNYTITHLGIDFPYPINDASGLINGSSNKEYLNITKVKSYNLTLFVNNWPPDNLNMPIVNRYDLLTLKAVVLNETDGPMSGELVRFYNFTGGDVNIGNATTNGNGEAFISITPGYNAISGPNLLYAQIGGEKNYSYYILNEAPNITITSGPTPLIINKSAGETFSVSGYIRDGVNAKPLNYSEVEIRIFRSGIDYTSNLTGGANPFTTLSDGSFSVTFGVDPSIPPGNYTIRLDFNGSYDLSSYPYSNIFTIPFLSTSKWTSNELQITYQAPLHLYFWINGIPSDDWENPIINRNEDLNLTALLMLGDTPLSGYSVDFWDKTQDDMFIGTAVTDIFGFATYIYETNTTTVAGPHLIYANYGARYNYSYFIIDAPISINLDISPIPSIINRSGSIGRTFNIHGYINDSLNGANPKFCEISVHLYNGATYVDSQLELITGSLQLGTSGEIDLIYRVKTNTNVQNYSIEVWFNGTFLYWNPYGIDNPHNFNQIQSISSNFTFSAICSNQLEVRDPEDIVILLTIDGNPALPIYNDLNLPERYNGGETINFQVQVNWSGNYAQSGDVKIYDFDNATNFELDSHTFIPADNGYWSFSIDTTGWHAGLHYIKVNWSGSIYPNSNTTYIIINKIVSITANSPVPNVVLRDSDSFTVSGTVQDGVTLRGLEVTIVLYDITMNNLSNYLNVQGGSRTILINPDGTFLFTINSIDLNCPHGTYYIRIDFNGSLYDFDTAIDITDYMIHASSSLRTFNITADTSIINANFNTTVDDTWYDGDTLWTWGNLIWDNLSSINSVQVNVSVKDGSGTLLASNTDFTDGSGNFLINITVDSSWVWGDTYVYVNFFPEDSFSAPDYYYIYDVTNQLVLRAP